MNKVIIGIVAILLVTTSLLLVLQNGDDNQLQNSNVTKNSNNADKNNSVATSTNGYVPFSEEQLSSAQDTKRIVFFHADWCSTCNFFENQIESQGVPEGITILKADYDTDTDLKDKYNVKVQSTFVLLDDEGNVERTWPFAQGLKNIQDLYDSVTI